MLVDGRRAYFNENIAIKTIKPKCSILKINRLFLQNHHTVKTSHIHKFYQENVF